MKKNSLFLVLFLLICVVKSNAQSTDKQYKQVLKDYIAHNYSTMLRHLDKLDDKYKSEASYLQYKAIANDSLGEYDAAVKEYDAYLLLNANDSSSASRVLTLKQILVVRSRCLKCKVLELSLKKQYADNAKADPFTTLHAKLVMAIRNRNVLLVVDLEKFKDKMYKSLVINVEVEERSPVIVATKLDLWKNPVEIARADLLSIKQSVASIHNQKML
ncbi:MAG: hypothetical protein IPK10_09925 [Bacteroidetes bacterium]|nr:hypothetical protein [Bacteroidota bacterium]